MIVNVDYPTIGNDDRTTAVKGVFSGALALLARQKATWPLVAGVLWRGIANIDSCLEVFRLAGLPDFAEVTRNNPKFVFKFLFSHYLAKGFTVDECASCFLHHYRYLRKTLSVPLLRQILDGEITLREFSDRRSRIALTIGLSRPVNKEGELSLNLRVDGEIVFVLAFTIVPGRMVKSDAQDILLISRMQGVRGSYADISFATKSLHDIAPRALLFAAVQGVAIAFGIAEIAAVSAARHTSCIAQTAAAFKLNYDDFFAELGIPKSASGFFFSRVPIEDKPLVLIKRGHKLRTKKKQAFKRQVVEDVSRLLRREVATKGAEYLCLDTPRSLLYPNSEESAYIEINHHLVSH